VSGGSLGEAGGTCAIIISVIRADLENRVLKSIDVARLAVEAASDKQADNIVMLDTKQVCSFADYFVICSGDSPRQIEAIRQEIRDKLKRDDIIPFHIEGAADSGWILLDLGDVVVHIFSPSQRDYYRLDDLWHEATAVIRIQ
jgi:ribosome-associated protein